jgi:hypothetical protein
MYTNEEAENSLTDDLQLAPALKSFIENRRLSVLQQLDSIETTSLENNMAQSNINEFQLFQNYPNPFNASTTILYIVRTQSDVPLQHVDLSVYNLLGKKITTLVNQKQSNGTYKVEWNARMVPSGIYFYRIKTNKGIMLDKKMILLK